MGAVLHGGRQSDGFVNRAVTIRISCGRSVRFGGDDVSRKDVFTPAQAYVHWFPLTTNSVTTSTRLLWANNLQLKQHFLISYNVKKFSYDEHPTARNTRFVPQSPRCKRDPVHLFGNSQHEIILHIISVSTEYVFEIELESTPEYWGLRFRLSHDVSQFTALDVNTF